MYIQTTIIILDIVNIIYILTTLGDHYKLVHLTFNKCSTYFLPLAFMGNTKYNTFLSIYTDYMYICN